MKNKYMISVCTTLCAITLFAKSPVVFLHGWNSDGGIWVNMKKLLKANAYYTDSDLHAFSYYSSAFGYSTSTPIQTVAKGVAREITEIYYDSGCQPVDLVTHSMGGLVVRAMLAYDLIDAKCIGRFISIAAPNYGQNAGEVGGYQACQMKYGSLFLWDLADAWHFKKKKITETLCIAGIDQTVNNSRWDGLVHAWSASLDDVPVRYVSKCHTPLVAVSKKANAAGGALVGFLFGGIIGAIVGGGAGYQTADESKVIYKCHDGVNDDVYRLVSNYLSSGWAYPQSSLKQSSVPSPISWQGGFFFQIIDEANEPAQYTSTSTCLVHTYWHVENDKRVMADYLEHGVEDNSSQSKGVELVYGTMPQGTYNLTVHPSQTTPAFTVSGVPVKCGRMTVVRLRSDGVVFYTTPTSRHDSVGGPSDTSQDGHAGDSLGVLPVSSHENTDETYYDAFCAWVRSVRSASDMATAGVESTMKIVFVCKVLDADGNVEGVAHVTVARPDKKGQSKVSAAFYGLDGRKRASRAVKANLSFAKGVPVAKDLKLELKGVGDPLVVTIGANGTVSGMFGALRLEAVKTLAKIAADSRFRIAEMPSAIDGMPVLNDVESGGEVYHLVPDGEGEAFSASGRKWVFAKPAKVKYAKNQSTKAYELVVDIGKDGERMNLSGLKLLVNTKTGVLKGRFTVYLEAGTPEKPKLKKKKFNVSGVLVDGVGSGRADCKGYVAKVALGTAM